MIHQPPKRPNSPDACGGLPLPDSSLGFSSVRLLDRCSFAPAVHPTHLHLFVFILLCCLIYRPICCSNEAVTHTHFYDPHMSSSVILLPMCNPSAFAQAVVRRLWAWCCSYQIWDMVFTCTHRETRLSHSNMHDKYLYPCYCVSFWGQANPWSPKTRVPFSEYCISTSEWARNTKYLDGVRSDEKEKKKTNCRLGTQWPRVQERRRAKIDGWMFMSV